MAAQSTLTPVVSVIAHLDRSGRSRIMHYLTDNEHREESMCGRIRNEGQAVREATTEEQESFRMCNVCKRIAGEQ